MVLPSAMSNLAVFHLPQYFVLFNISEQNMVFQPYFHLQGLYIVQYSIILRPKEAMLKAWWKLVFSQIFLFSENLQNFVLPLRRTKQNENPTFTANRYYHQISPLQSMYLLNLVTNKSGNYKLHSKEFSVNTPRLSVPMTWLCSWTNFVLKIEPTQGIRTSGHNQTSMYTIPSHRHDNLSCWKFDLTNAALRDLTTSYFAHLRFEIGGVPLWK